MKSASPLSGPFGRDRRAASGPARLAGITKTLSGPFGRNRRAASGPARLAGATTAIRGLAAGVLIATLACSTTTFVSTWRSPEARPLRLSGARVVAVFMTNSAERRRRAEDALASEITKRGAQGVPSYTVLSDSEVRDEDTVRAKLEQAGYQGAVVMRVVGRETQYTYETGYWVGHPYYTHVWHEGYWGWGWGHVYEPGYLREDRVVSVETLVYSFTQDKLVWAGVSRTVDPTHVDGLISEIADAATEQMKKDGLLGGA